MVVQQSQLKELGRAIVVRPLHEPSDTTPDFQIVNCLSQAWTRLTGIALVKKEAL